MLKRIISPIDGQEQGLTLNQESLVGCWTGDPARIGMQFESICFAQSGSLEAHVVTMCVRGFCPSVRSLGTYEVLTNDRLLLTLDGIGQEFIAWKSDERLNLCDPISGMTKVYLPAQENQ